MALVARCAKRSDLLEVGESIPARTSTTLSPMSRLVHLPAPACHALLCPRLVMTTRGSQGHLASPHVSPSEVRGTGMHRNLFVTLSMRDPSQPGSPSSFTRARGRLLLGILDLAAIRGVFPREKRAESWGVHLLIGCTVLVGLKVVDCLP